MTAPKMDPKYWATTDGRRYTSVPAPVPVAWQRMLNDSGRIVYVSGAYSIERTQYVRGQHGFVVYRDGVKLSALAYYGLLRDAKARAATNAEGRDVVNVA